MTRSTGLGAASLELLRPTAPPAEPRDGPSAPDELEAGDPEGRGDPAPEVRPTGKPKARNLHLTDDVHDRLWLLARQRKTTVSAVANDLLDKALPRWRMEREG